MGCDIHAVVEKKVGEKWVMVNRLCLGEHDAALRRNYARFAALAGVRGDGPEPKGLPADISDSTKLYVAEWAGYGHSHSFLELTEAARIFLETDHSEKQRDYKQEYPGEHFFGIDEEAYPGEYRLVFWFDN